MRARTGFAAMASAVTVLAVSISSLGTQPAAASVSRAAASCAGPRRPHPVPSLRPVPAPYCVPMLSGRPLRAGKANWRRLIARRNALAHAAGNWQNIGPASLDAGPGGEGEATSADSGRAISIVYDAPLAELFLGTANGGIWKSSSPFTSWRPLTDSMPDLAVGALAVDPTVGSGDTIYAGTGEPNGCGDCMYGAGIYKSTDGGATWTQEGAATFGFDTFSAIVVNPITGTIYASAQSSFGGGGLWMSTDQGVTWSNPSNLSSDSVSDLQIDSLGDVYASVGANKTNQPHNGIWECVAPCTPAAGMLLTEINGSAGHLLPIGSSADIKFSLADPPTTPGSQTLYAILADKSNPDNVLGLYRTTSAGLPATQPSWTQIGTVANFDNYEQQASYNLAIFAADVSDVYVSLENIYKVTSANSAPAYTDLTCVYGAGTADPGSCSGQAAVHTDQHAIAPGPSGTTFFANDGGIVDTTTGGATWNNLNGNLSTLQFYGGALGNDSGTGGCVSSATVLCDGTIRVGGTQDNGCDWTSGTVGIRWSLLPPCGDGGEAAIDPTNNNNQWVEGQYSDIWGTNDNWNSSFESPPYPCGGLDDTSDFISPMLYDPTTATLLSAPGPLCSGAVSPGSINWSDISGGLTPNPIIAIARSHAGGTDAIYIADSNGDLWYHTSAWHSMDGDCTSGTGPNCAAVYTSGKSAGLQACGSGFGLGTDALAADPTNPGIVYAVLSSFQGSSAGHVFRGVVNFTNNTVSWTDISGALPDEPYESVAIDPSAVNTIFVGGSPGVYETQDAQDATPSWLIMGNGLPNSPVLDLHVSVDGSTLVAFTHGRSVWQISATPTAVQYAGLESRISRGWTILSWRSTERVAGFNIYKGPERLNRLLVTSRTNLYTFRIHLNVRRPKLAAVPLR